jgi:hypothetical protein
MHHEVQTRLDDVAEARVSMHDVVRQSTRGRDERQVDAASCRPACVTPYQASGECR